VIDRICSVTAECARLVIVYCIVIHLDLFLHVLGVLFGLMTTRLNKRYYYYRPTSAVISFYVAFCKLNDKRT